MALREQAGDALCIVSVVGHNKVWGGDKVPGHKQAEAGAGVESVEPVRYREGETGARPVGEGAARRGRPRGFEAAAWSFLLVVAGWSGKTAAQDASSKAEVLSGVVLNSVTHEPIARALVSSPDSRFATLTNSEGRFEFALAKMQEPAGGSTGDPSASPGPTPSAVFDRPSVLFARKPGFLAEPYGAQNLQDETVGEVTLTLIPESLIVGTVTLPTSEAPDSVGLQIFLQQVQDGRAHWIPVGATQTTSEGQFRFADLAAGSYKLLTHELMDRDPLDGDPFSVDRSAQAFGYPPVYYQNAPDFASAATVEVRAGETATVNLSLVRQPYYRVKIPVAVVGGDAPEGGVMVNVYAHGHKGPGFALAYVNADRAIEGLLPNGTYTVEAASYGSVGMTGVQTLVVKGRAAQTSGRKGGGDAPVVTASPMTLTPMASIPVIVKEEFTAPGPTNAQSWNVNGRNFTARGPRRYLSVALEPADDFGLRGRVGLRNPAKAGDEALFLDGVAAGSYWVRVNSARGYAASVRSGDIDLQRQPLTVSAGASPPIEITMRDDTAEISGTVEGITPAGKGGTGGSIPFSNPLGGAAGAHIYCIPLGESGGQFSEIWVNADGSFVSQGLAPGTYRLLAFDREQRALEYRNPEVMRAYDSKGQVVRVGSGAKEQVQLQAISSSASWSQP